MLNRTIFCQYPSLIRAASGTPPLIRISAALGVLICLAVSVALAQQDRAKQTFHFYQDENNYVVMEVETFAVEKAGPGYATLLLNPYPVELANSILALGKKTEFGEEALPGEATWLAYVPQSKRVVVRLAATLTPDLVPAGMVVLSAQQAKTQLTPVEIAERALEAARALQSLGFSADALSLLEDMAQNPAYEASRCRILKAILELQAPATLDSAQDIPEVAHKTLRDILTRCQGAEADETSRWFSARQIKRVELAGLPLKESKALLNDARNLCGERPGGDALLLALARLHRQDGLAEEGLKALDLFEKTYGKSSLAEEARNLKAVFQRRIPARSHQYAGPAGPERARKAFDLREVTAMCSGPKGQLVVADRGSDPPQIVLLDFDPVARSLNLAKTFFLDSKARPISVAWSASGEFFVLDSRKKQILVLNDKGEEQPDRCIAREGEGWKFDEPKQIALLQNSEVLVLDAGAPGIHRFSVAKGRHLGFISLKSAKLGSIKCFDCAPDGLIGVASSNAWTVFTAEEGPQKTEKAERGRTQELSVKGIALGRWRNVYLFDGGENRIEKFRRDGVWLITVADFRKDAVGEPDLYALTPDGDILVYNGSKDRFFFYAQ